MINKVKELKVKVVGVRVDKQTLSFLEKRAAKENRTISSLVGIWIAERIEKEARLKKAG